VVPKEMTKKRMSPAPENSYWVMPGSLMAGAYPAHPSEESRHHGILQELLACGVTDFINLVEPEETGMGGHPFRGYFEDYRRLAPPGLQPEMHRFPLVDEGVPAKETMVRILDKIDELFDQRRVIYVHCWGGKGRTGTVVGCWLIRNHQSTPDKVLTHLMSLTAAQRDFFWHTPSTPEQEEYVKDWEPNQ